MKAASKTNLPKIQYGQIQLGGGVTQTGVSYPGGLDQTTPSLRLQSGAVRSAQNFEAAQQGGYSRIQGYERVDGHASPSAAVFTVIQLFSFTNVPTVGQVVTQAASGAFGTVVAVVTAPVPYLVLTQVSGVFLQGNGRTTFYPITTPGPVTVGNVVFLTITVSPQNQAIYTAAAADVYRALIAAVPGSGSVLGVVAMAFANVDNLYAFRANTGGSAVLIYKATSAGWVAVPFFNLVSFTGGGSAVPMDGDVLTQGGVTATIQRVMWQSGAWTGTAIGQFVITNPTGGSFAGGAATTSSGANVTLSGAQTAIALSPGGRFEFTKCNFSGQAVTRRIFGSDGVNPCFEFDGVTLAPIKTGLSPDAPTHIYFHKNYLVVSQQASIIGCGVGTPFKWDVIDGGWEIATGDTVNGLVTLPGSQTTATLCVFLKTNTAFLYGTDPTTFNFVTFSNGIGAVPYSAQNLFDTFFLDPLGAVTLKTTLNWGNFLPSTLTKNILPFIESERGNLVASSIQRAKSQYRLYFDDGYALFCTIINGQYLGSMPILFPNPIFCVDEETLLTDVEVTYAGGTDGFVYQLDVGTGFDGAPIPAYFTTAWDAAKSPRILKRYRAASMEVQGAGFLQVQIGWQVGYGNDQNPTLPAITATVNAGDVPYWDSFEWDQFTWDGTGLYPTDVDMTETGENVQFTITSGTNYTPAFTVDSLIYHYSMRRGIRV